MDDEVDPAVGFVITAKPGDFVDAGEPLASIYARDKAGVERGRATLRSAITIGDDAEPPLKLVSHRVSKAGLEEL
jgi:pyrimidine-nucleoside phosphorylase